MILLFLAITYFLLRVFFIVNLFIRNKLDEKKKEEASAQYYPPVSTDEKEMQILFQVLVSDLTCYIDDENIIKISVYHMSPKTSILLQSKTLSFVSSTPNFLINNAQAASSTKHTIIIKIVYVYHRISFNCRDHVYAI